MFGSLKFDRHFFAFRNLLQPSSRSASLDDLSNPKPGHSPKGAGQGGAGQGATPRGAAGQGGAGCGRGEGGRAGNARWAVSSSAKEAAACSKSRKGLSETIP